MSKPYALFSVTCLLLGASPSVFGDTAGGSGEPRIQLQVTADQRALLSLSEDQTLAVGSAQLNQGYAELPLDAFGSQSSQNNWGRAEVLLGCGVADVLIYQRVDGYLQEHIAIQLTVNMCIK